MIRRPPRSTQGVSSAASDVYKRQMLFYRLLGAISVIQPHRDSKRSSPLLKASMKQNWSSEKIARALYQGITAQYLDALPQPLNCELFTPCLLYTSPSPRDLSTSRMPSSA
eukprot:TRINITY_DN23751_c0_g1_i1.p3 TRINITY_DN23751_c0_g1~~TRINITY_DN23751_c0_g1_i1.p3  ORF type:complete len:111 (-),score=23.30 TRINITY_DN23751_c0_g1_i1:60-392(-)